MNPPGSSVHGIFPARLLEQFAISFSRGSAWPKDWTHVSGISCIGTWILYHWATWEAQWTTLIFLGSWTGKASNCECWDLHVAASILGQRQALTGKLSVQGDKGICLSYLRSGYKEVCFSYESRILNQEPNALFGFEVWIWGLNLCYICGLRVFEMSQ